jgi:large subunit ribosomal protein L15
MKLNDVHAGITKHRKRRRIGRGTGSGYGKTCGRGHKGQGSRAGWSRHPTFQGGGMPLVRRIPKRGFNNKWGSRIVVINVGDLDTHFQSGDAVTPHALEQTSLLGHRYDQIKILGDGQLTKKLTVSAHRFSASAVQKIEQAGGRVERLPGPTPVETKKQQKSRPKA